MKPSSSSSVPSSSARTSCRVCGSAVVRDQRFCGECGVDLAIERGIAPSEEARLVADPLVGRTLADRYRIVRCIGRGGMGVVYEVEHVHIGKRLAMKLLHGELAHDPTTLRRLRREAETASRLSDSGTVQVFDFGQSDGLAYLVMELVEGEDLGQRLRRDGSLPFAVVARFLLDVCASLAEAHALGVIHRDLKPENVMITRSAGGERAKVLDFGLAMLRWTGSESVSRSGSIVGTPYYMAPEQIRGELVDGRADVYSLGGLLYRAVAGVPPFAGDSAIVVLTQHLSEAPVPPSRRGVGLDPQAEAIVMRCLAKKPTDRFASVSELREELLAWLEAHGEASARSATDAPRPRADAFATRRDIDAYENRLRRRSRLTSLGVALASSVVVGVVAALGWGAMRPTESPTSEVEPNQSPAEATPLAPGIELRGQLGRRIDTERGDVDVYRLRFAPGTAAFSASVTALPNLDIVLEVYREGGASPLLTVDGHGVGEGESLAGFPVVGEGILLLVRERWIRGRYPIENVSDEYTVRFDPMPDGEGELDGDVERARRLRIGEVAVGRIGWPDDVDVLCIDAPFPAVNLTMSVEPGFDVAIHDADAPAQSPPLADVGRAGAAEHLALEAVATGRRCLRIEASRHPEAPAIDESKARYRALLLER